MKVKNYMIVKNTITGEIENINNYKEFKEKYDISSDAATIAYKCGTIINGIEIQYKHLADTKNYIAYDTPVRDRFGKTYENMYVLCNELGTDRIYKLLDAINNNKLFYGHRYYFVYEPDYSLLNNKYKISSSSKVRILLNRDNNEVYLNALDAANKLRVSANSVYRSISTKNFEPIFNIIILNVSKETRYYLKDKLINGKKIFFKSERDPSKYTLDIKDFEVEDSDKNKIFIDKLNNKEEEDNNDIKIKRPENFNLPLEHLATLFNMDEEDLIDEALALVPKELMDLKTEVIDIDFSKEAFDILYRKLMLE